MICERCGQKNANVSKRCVGCNHILWSSEPGPSDTGPAVDFSTTSNPRCGESSNAPYPGWGAIFSGATAGIIVTLLFCSLPLGKPEFAFLNHSWILLPGPVVSGALTVYSAENGTRRRWRDYIIAPVMTISLLSGVAFVGLLVTSLFACAGLAPSIFGLADGSAACVAGMFMVAVYAGIASIFALPVLFLAGASGGLLMGLLFKALKRGT